MPENVGEQKNNDTKFPKLLVYNSLGNFYFYSFIAMFYVGIESMSILVIF